MKAGTDGLPLGDLNWFPTQKATFVANQTSYVKAIESLAGQFVIDSVKSMMEAEAGGIGGTATVQQNKGFIYWTYSNVGNLTWTFNAPAAGIYGTRWVVNLNGAGGSQGMVLQINGQQINDKALGWGATPFASGSNLPGCLTEGMSGTDWLWVKMDTSNCTSVAAFTLNAGSNTIGVAPGGWNFWNLLK